jgi:hypothetical protein
MYQKEIVEKYIETLMGLESKLLEIISKALRLESYETTND